ncbi:MAG: type I-C CRISPR-associated protein Cas7/Csd2 [Planctomycetota bacterium]
MSNVVTNRHDFLVLFDVANGNPNGDPDAGNMPRIDPNTNKGIVSDVCLKRKVRNFVELFKPERKAGDCGNNILIRQGAVLNTEITKGRLAAGESLDKSASDDQKAEAAMRWLCRELFDVRAFGAVLSTGDEIMKGSAFGQVRGPVQFTFGQSFHPITPLEITVTRCAVTKEEDASKERTMGHKHIVPYALYAAKGYISPPFAEKTGFTNADLELLFEALNHMFEHDRSAARGEMAVRGIYDFEHVGSQHVNNAEQNKREARLGCYHAHKLLEGVTAKLKDGKSFPESFNDYDVTCAWNEENLPKGVVLNLRHELPTKTIRFKS